MRLLFIPPPGPASDLRSGVWPALADHAEIDLLPIERPAQLLAKHGQPIELGDCLALAERVTERRYDYVVGHANALLWLSVFRTAGSQLPFAVVPNYNHVQPYDIFVLALAAQFRTPGDVLFTGSRASARAFERFVRR